MCSWNSRLACPMISIEIAGCPSSSGRSSSFPAAVPSVKAALPVTPSGRPSPQCECLCLLPGSSMSRSPPGVTMRKIQSMLSCGSLRAQPDLKWE